MVLYTTVVGLFTIFSGKSQKVPSCTTQQGQLAFRLNAHTNTREKKRRCQIITILLFFLLYFSIIARTQTSRGWLDGASAAAAASLAEARKFWTRMMIVLWV